MISPRDRATRLGVVHAGVLALVLTASACAASRRPPYGPGQGPQTEALLAAAEPTITALQVPRARIREGGLSGTLMYAVQSPGRFSGTLQVAGNELLSVAMHEDGYAMRVLIERGALPGFYEGPPSTCAVGSLLGVELGAEEVARVMLGSWPRVVGHAEAKALGWDPRSRTEKLVLDDGKHVQELRFAWSHGGWRFAGTTVWAREGEARTWVLSVHHHTFDRVNDAILPTKTTIARPDGRKRVELEIRVLERVVDPASWHTDGGDDGWDDDDGGWEDAEGEGDGDGDDGRGEARGPGGARSDDADEADMREIEGPLRADEIDGPPAPTHGGPSSHAAEAPRPGGRASHVRPAVFDLQADGLRRRGDLCR